MKRAATVDRSADFVLGWDWQLPVPLVEDHFLAASHHRVIGGIDVLPPKSDSRVRGRFGYRYDRRYVIAGLAVAVDHQGFGWSPEIGVKFLHLAEPSAKPFDPSLHFLVRANLAPELDRLRGVTFLLGWNLL